MTVWFMRPFIDPRRYVSGFDTSTYSGPNLRFTLTELTHGRIPLWNDTIFGGAPHLGNTQTGALYLPKLLFAGMNLNRAMNLLVAAHVLLLALGLLALIRRLGCRPPAGLIAALAGVGSGAILTRSVQFEQILVISWVPLVMVVIHVVITSPRVWRAVGIAALVFAGSVLAGHPQMTYLVGAMAAAWTVAVVITHRAWHRLGPLALAGASAAMLCGLQLLATRAATRSSAITGGRPLETLRLPDRSIEPGRMAQVVLGTVRDIEPGYNSGAFETVGYVGAAVVALAVIGVVANWRKDSSATHGRRAVVVSLAVLAVGSAILATGSRTGLFEVLYRHLPGFDLMRVSARWITVTDLCLAILAGLGVDGLRRSDARRSALIALGTCIAVVAGLAFTQRVTTDSLAVTGWLVAAGLVVGGVLLSRVNATQRATLATLARLAWVLPVVAVGLELGVAGQHAYGQKLATPASFTNYTSAPTEWLKGQPGWTLAVTADRLADPYYLLPGLRPNANTLFGIRSIDGYDGGVQVSKRWLAMVGTFADTANFELTMRSQLPPTIDPTQAARVGIRWALIDVGQASTRLPGWRGPMAADETFEVYENPAWRGEAILRGTTGSETIVSASRRTPTNIEADVAAEQPGQLVVSSQWDAGWRVSIDGNPASTDVIDGFLLGVAVPPGNHQVRFTYRPDWLLPGLALMLFGVLAVTAALVADHRRWGGPGRPDPSSATS